MIKFIRYKRQKNTKDKILKYKRFIKNNGLFQKNSPTSKKISLQMICNYERKIYFLRMIIFKNYKRFGNTKEFKCL